MVVVEQYNPMVTYNHICNNNASEEREKMVENAPRYAPRNESYWNSIAALLILIRLMIISSVTILTTSLRNRHNTIKSCFASLCRYQISLWNNAYILISELFSFSICVLKRNDTTV